MLKFESVLSAFFLALVHLLTVIFLSTKNKRNSKLTCLKLFTAIFIITFSADVFIKSPYICLPVMFFLIPVCTFFIYNLCITEAFALSIMSDLIVLFGEISAHFLMNQWDKFFINENLIYTVIKNLSMTIITAVVISAAVFIRKRPYINRKIKKYNMQFVILFVCTVALFNIFLMASDTVDDKLYLYNFSYKICIFLLLMFAVYINTITKIEHQKQKYMQLFKYTRVIEEMYEKLESQRHNFSNILFSINGYLDDNRISELQDYMNNHVLKDYCRNKDNNYLKHLKHIQNPALKGILYSKLNQAATKNIKLFVNIFDNIEINSIAPADLVKIIGILFDNAIEACEDSTQNEIHLGMESDQTHTSIIIGNTYYQLPDLNMMSRRGYSTKGENRGFGLYNVKKILSLYPNAHLKTSVCGDIFFQELIIMK